jgi:hypothetical protein
LNKRGKRSRLGEPEKSNCKPRDIEERWNNRKKKNKGS